MTSQSWHNDGKGAKKASKVKVPAVRARRRGRDVSERFPDMSQCRLISAPRLCLSFRVIVRPVPRSRGGPRLVPRRRRHALQPADHDAPHAGRTRCTTRRPHTRACLSA